MEAIRTLAVGICFLGFGLEALAMLALSCGPVRRRLRWSPLSMASLGLWVWLAGAVAFALTGGLSRW